MTLVPISKDIVYCFSGRDGRVNSAVIRGRRGTVVIDAQVTLEDGQALRRAAVEVSGDKPVLYLVITHEHFDHVAGNQFFSCEIVSSRRARDEMLKIDRQVPGFVLTPPTVTFDNSLEISLGDLTLVITHHGGHSSGECSVFIPESRILVAGDLVFEGRDPYVGSADIVQWVNTLGELYMLMPDVVVPGHGSPSGREVLLEQRTYLEKFYEQITGARRNGIPADEAGMMYCEERHVAPERRAGFVEAARRIYGSA